MWLQVVAAFLDLIFGDLIANDTQCRLAAHALLQHNSDTRRLLDKVLSENQHFFAQQKLHFSVTTMSVYITRFELIRAPETLTTNKTRECMSSILRCTTTVLKNERAIAENLKAAYRELLKQHHAAEKEKEKEKQEAETTSTTTKSSGAASKKGGKKSQTRDDSDAKDDQHGKSSSAGAASEVAVEHYTALYDALRDAAVGLLEKVMEHDNLASLRMDRLGVHLHKPRHHQQPSSSNEKRGREEEEEREGAENEQDEQMTGKKRKADANAKTQQEAPKQHAAVAIVNYASDATSAGGGGGTTTSSSANIPAASVVVGLNDLMCPPSDFEKVHPITHQQQLQVVVASASSSSTSSPSSAKKQNKNSKQSRAARIESLGVANVDVVSQPTSVVGALSQQSQAPPRRQLILPKEMPLAVAVLGGEDLAAAAATASAAEAGLGGLISSSEPDLFSVRVTQEDTKKKNATTISSSQHHHHPFAVPKFLGYSNSRQYYRCDDCDTFHRTVLRGFGCLHQKQQQQRDQTK